MKKFHPSDSNIPAMTLWNHGLVTLQQRYQITSRRMRQQIAGYIPRPPVASHRVRHNLSYGPDLP